MIKEILPTEESEQAALFEWAHAAQGKYPELKLMHAIPNGGYRHVKTAVALRRTGVKAGVPDIFLPAARGKAHGLYIEMKRREGGRLSDCQKRWIVDLQLQGYLTVVCHGWDEAREKIVAYLDEESDED